MKIGLIGYGKMGKAVEAIALTHGHEIVARITELNRHDLSLLRNADVAIEFTGPDAVLSNLYKCLELGVPVVTGSTGWHQHLATVKQRFIEEKGALLYASNFSIGVNIFMEINSLLASLMNSQPQYNPSIREIHHTQKLDAPSGTAITLANDILENLQRKTIWVNSTETQPNQLEIISERLPEVPGTHEIVYDSDADEIRIIHTARNRSGFANGALLAANWLPGKVGVFTMKDILNINSSK
jgi:4-hydroxy-tetrahydrodipicolinate reductase